MTGVYQTTMVEFAQQVKPRFGSDTCGSSKRQRFSDAKLGIEGHLSSADVEMVGNRLAKPQQIHASKLLTQRGLNLNGYSLSRRYFPKKAAVNAVIV